METKNFKYLKTARNHMLFSVPGHQILCFLCHFLFFLLFFILLCQNCEFYANIKFDAVWDACRGGGGAFLHPPPMGNRVIQIWANGSSFEKPGSITCVLIIPNYMQEISKTSLEHKGPQF